MIFVNFAYINLMKMTVISDFCIYISRLYIVIRVGFGI